MTASDLLRHDRTANADEAEIVVDPDTRGERVTPYLYGKFCEHLGTNIYHGMEAQILFNPVFGAWHVRAEERHPDGGYESETDREKIRRTIEAHDRPLAYPAEVDADALLAAYDEGLAFGWLPTDDAVRVSPDTGPEGGRAQRIETADGGGVSQRTRLPLHRVREFEFRCRLRAADRASVEVSISGPDGASLATASVEADSDWQTVESDLQLAEADDSGEHGEDVGEASGDVGEGIDEDGVYTVTLSTPESANLVVERLLLYPGDHVDHADPEVIDYLRESDLPLLRWPGGNFVSAYDWRDGVGPVDERPTKPNPAWDGLEYNLFGTDEFVRFCENVGCEPTVCVNAGTGTPAEAAAWVEYCNGDPEETEMGRLRAENGHPEPYGITYWEIGNELWGRWQNRWTTPAGNADRYRRFREAMLDADPDIAVTACGLVTDTDGGAWNDVLLDECGETVRALSAHPLAGGEVGPDTDPDELFEAFMGYSTQLGEEYAYLRDRMAEAGVEEPKLDVTELQLFAQFRDDTDEGYREGEGGEHGDEAGEDADASADRLTPETMPTPTTIAEALYDATVRNECIRLGGFVEMLTHSATVNHGGGLSKAGERVWADPCHYGRKMGFAQAGETPVGVELACDTISTGESFREIDPVEDAPALDCVATVADDGTLTLLVVNRASRDDPTTVSVDASALAPEDGPAELVELSAPTMHATNTRAAPETVAPETTTVPLEGGRVTVDVPPYGMVRVTIPSERRSDDA